MSASDSVTCGVTVYLQDVAELVSFLFRMLQAGGSLLG